MNEGTKLGYVYLYFSPPAFDNHLLELTMAIREDLWANSYVYNRILLCAFLDYFHSNPCMKLSAAISRHLNRNTEHQFWRRAC